MNTPWTPGPWHWGDGFSDPADKYADCQLCAADGSTVIPIRGDHHEPIWDTDWPDCDDEDEASKFDPESIKPTAPNRALIAAAPDLAEALTELVSLSDEVTCDPESDISERSKALLAKARAALAKAGVTL